MTTPDMTIVEFLKARIEQDRGDAQYVLNIKEKGSWPMMFGSVNGAISSSCHQVIEDARIKLAIIESEPPEVTCNQAHPMMDVWHSDGHGPGIVLRLLASAYAAHSDYRQTWAV